MTKVILLNGPRQVGKDFIADKFVEDANSARKLPIMWPAKIAAMAEHGFTTSQVQYFETCKDTKQPLLAGIADETPRSIYIEYGTRMREEHGDGYFAKMWAEFARRYRGYGVIVVPDVRFQAEVDEALREFGEHNVMLVRVRQDDFDWQGDIGHYCEHWMAIDFDNTAQSPDVGLLLHERTRGLML